MTDRLLILGAWLLLLAVAFVTLSPIEWRPISPFHPQVERFVSFGLIGFVFCVAYPRRIGWVTLCVLGAATGLEVLQFIAPGRHGRLIDLAAKLAGGGMGIAAGWALSRWRELHARS